MLAREDVAKVSSEVLGCTPAAKDYDLVKQDKTYRFWDTPGLNEGEEGNVPAQKAINELFELVKTMSVSLIICCVRGGRLTDIVRVNCDMFCRIICEGKVPIVLVVTGLEQEDNMDQWWTKFEKDVRRLDLAFKEHACVTTIKGRNGLYSKEYEQSANKVWRLVESCCSSTPWILTPNCLDEIPKRMARYMAEYNACTGKEKQVLDWHRPIPALSFMVWGTASLKFQNSLLYSAQRYHFRRRRFGQELPCKHDRRPRCRQSVQQSYGLHLRKPVLRNTYWRHPLLYL